MVLLVAVAVLGPVVRPFDPGRSDVAHALQAPGALHWFGTDQLGRDLFSRVLVAARLDLLIAAASVAPALVAGTLLGGACGLRGGRVDRWIGRGVDTLMAFPLFVLAMALVAVLGNDVVAVIAATALVNLPFYIRLARTQAALRRDAAYVRAARLGGSGEWRVLTRVVLPNAWPVLAAQARLNLGWAMLNVSGLAFIGLGVRPPTPEWGILASEGAPFLLTGQWWLATFPALALLAAVLALTRSPP